MLESIYHMTLKLIKKCIFLCENFKVIMDVTRNTNL